MQSGVGGAGGDAVKVARDGPHVFVYAPFVIVEHHDEALRRSGDVIHRLESGAAGEGGITRNTDDVLVRALEVAGDGKPQRRTQRCAGVTRAIAIVLTLCTQEKTVQALILPHGIQTVPAAREHLVDVALMAHVEDEFVRRRIENAVHSHAQFHHAEVGAEVASGLGQGGDEVTADLPGELGQQLVRQRLYVRGALDRRQWLGARIVGFRHCGHGRGKRSYGGILRPARQGPHRRRIPVPRRPRRCG